MSDPIADLLTRVRNGQKAGHEVVSVPASKLKIAVTDILKNEGFIRNYKCIRDKRQGVIKIALKYTEEGTGVIRGVHRVSSPGGRVYVNAGKLPYIKNGFGIAIVSTSRGVLTDRDARKHNVGGEFICAVY